MSVLVAMAGLPGTGKSTLARLLAELLPAAVLDKDRVRAALFAPDEIEYSPRQDDLVIEAILPAAGFLLAQGRAVILDGRTFYQRVQVEQVAAFARRLAVPLKMILCECSDDTARRRLERDQAQNAHPAKDRGYPLYLRLKQQWQPIELLHLVVDTTCPPDECARQALAYIHTAQG